MCRSVKFLKTVFDTVLDTVFPGKCLCCGDVIEPYDLFCDYCYENIHVTEKDRLCLSCGNLTDNCRCKNTVFAFNGCTAPFFNDSAARKAMYAFKFRRKLYAADFFAENMAKSVRSAFPDISFDAVTYVPLPMKRELRRGYNQSRELAVRLSKIMNITFAHEMLKCDPKRNLQHETAVDKRFENVNGKFFSQKHINGGIILLVDDIKTTGATLDECSKQLLSAGASEVYCVTGIISKPKDKNSGGYHGNRYRN